MDLFDRLAEQMLERMPPVAAIWYRHEADSVVDVRIQLSEDTWDNREAAIDTMLELQREFIDHLLINFSFVLPDVAYDGGPDGAPTPAAVDAPRVLSFV